MRRPFQSLKRDLGLSAATAAAFFITAAVAAAQERPHAPESPARAGESTAPTPIEPAQREDRIESRPPDCLDCRPLTTPRPSLITNPSWIRPPQPEFPTAAMSAKIPDGRVAVACTVVPAGDLSDCRVVEETPQGFGFGAAALAASAQARISPRTVDGVAVDARVHFTIRFRLP